MLEKEIEKKLITGVKRLGCGARCLKFVSPGFRGVPDRIILLPGAKVIFVELKKPGKTERVRQTYVQELFRGLDFEVFSSVNTIERINDVLNKCREEIESEELCSP